MRLETYLQTIEQTEAAFARALGVSQVTINRYVRNERFPDPEMIERISKATHSKVAVTDWHQQAADHRASKQGAAA